MTMTAEQKAARLALIKQIADKRNAAADFKRKQQLNAAKVRRYTDVVDKPSRKAAQAKFDREIARMDENHNQWTDASSYAKEYYGDVAYQTTRYDNDWN